MDERKSLLQEFRAGSFRDRLGIVSDVISVLGISVATLAGGAFAFSNDIYVDNLMGIVISVPLFLAISAVFLTAALITSNWLGSRLQKQPVYHWLLQFAFWCAIASGVLLASYFTYALLDSIPIVRGS